MKQSNNLVNNFPKFKKYISSNKVIENTIGKKNIIKKSNPYPNIYSTLNPRITHVLFKKSNIKYNFYILRASNSKNIITNIKTKNNIISCIPELIIFDNKLTLWKNILKYYNLNIAKSIMPNTYLIPDDKQRFKDDYKNNNKYILKKLYRGGKSGVTVINNYNQIIKEFDKGHNINKYSGNDYLKDGWQDLPFHLIQEFKNNPFLISGYKTNFRFFIVCIYNNKKLNYYLLNDGIISYSGIKFDPNNISRNNNITNLNDSKILSDSHKYENGLPYLISHLKNYKEIIRKIKNDMTKTVKTFTFNNLNYEHKMFQVFGCDGEIDKELNFYLYEMNNFYAASKYYSDSRYIIIEKMLNNIFYKLNINNNKYDDLIEL